MSNALLILQIFVTLCTSSNVGPKEQATCTMNLIKCFDSSNQKDLMKVVSCIEKLSKDKSSPWIPQ